MTDMSKYWRELITKVSPSDVVTVTVESGASFAGVVVDVDDFAVLLETEGPDQTTSHAVDIESVVAVTTCVRHS